MDYFNDHAAHSQSLIRAHYAGRDCWQATAAIDDDIGGNYGDGLGGVIRKRAQKSGKVKISPPCYQAFEFSLCFPSEWVFAPNPMTVVSIHHNNTLNPQRGVAPLDFLVRDNVLYCLHYPTVGESKKKLFERIIVPDMWYDFKIGFKFSTGNDGFIQIHRNEQMVANFIGKTIDPDDTDIYLKVGPYVFRAFPDGVNYRRMYFQI